MSKPITIKTRKVLNKERFIEEWIKIMFPSLTNSDKMFLKQLMMIYPCEYSNKDKHLIVSQYLDRANFKSVLSNSLKSLCDKHYGRGRILYKIRRGNYTLDAKIKEYLIALSKNNVTQFIIELELNQHAI